ELRLDKCRVIALRDRGVLIFDVDDTLLARRGGGSADGETFHESHAAQLIPGLLRKGFHIAIVTGHGWQQLERRLISPIFERASAGDLARLWIYANRGATRLLNDNGQPQI